MQCRRRCQAQVDANGCKGWHLLPLCLLVLGWCCCCWLWHAPCQAPQGYSLPTLSPWRVPRLWQSHAARCNAATNLPLGRTDKRQHFVCMLKRGTLGAMRAYAAAGAGRPRREVSVTRSALSWQKRRQRCHRLIASARAALLRPAHAPAVSGKAAHMHYAGSPVHTPTAMMRNTHTNHTARACGAACSVLQR